MGQIWSFLVRFVINFVRLLGGKRSWSGGLLYTWGMLICFDMDDTLLNSQHRVAPGTAAALAQLRANGHRVMLISSRPTRSVYLYAQSLGLEDEMHVSLGGSYLFRGQQALYDQPAEPALCARAAQVAEGLKLHISAYSGWLWLANFREHYLRIEEHIVGFEADELRDLATHPVAPNKLVAMGEPHQTRAYADAMRQSGLAFTVNIDHPRFYELTAPGINKSSGLRHACDLLGITAADVVAFGDGDNDVDMLRFAGIGVAMANALPVAKAAADKIAGHHDEGGIEKMLAELGLV